MKRSGATRARDLSVELARVEAEKCTGCGVCADSICLAMSLEAGQAKVDAGRCVACGMCVVVCPHEAVTLD